MSKRAINKNFKHLVQNYNKEEVTGCVLEGSSRSGKTISSVDFIIYLCSKVHENVTINIVRQNYNSFKKTLYLDFDKRLRDFGIKSPFQDSKEVASFKLFNNQINFLSAENSANFEGAGSDYWYFNEMIDIPQQIFDLAEQRCRMFWWGDFNPKKSRSWIYDNVLKRNDVSYLHSTFLDNPFIAKTEKKKILSYEPTEYNIEQGTANEFMWNVYGLGIRCASNELVFKQFNYFNSEDKPKEYDFKVYGLDFGFSQSPNALVEVIMNGNNLYLTELLYETGLTNLELGTRVKTLIDNTREYYIVCDSAEPKTIMDLRKNHQLRCIEAKKGPDSIQFGLKKLMDYKIFINKDSKNLEHEFLSYSFAKDKSGLILDSTVKKQDHLIDALRYAVTKFSMKSK